MRLPITRYILTRVNLVRAACPRQLEASVENQAQGLAIVIEANVHKYGINYDTDYYPKAVIVAGADTRRRLLANGGIHGWAWVEKGSMDILPEHSIQTKDLLHRLQAAVIQRTCGPKIFPGQSIPGLVACYPVENQLIYGMHGKLYRQQFAISSEDRRILLNASPLELTACGGIPMARVQTGARYSEATNYPALAVPSKGAPNSELVTEIVRDWSDIEEAVRMYVDATKNGIHKPLAPRFQPVKLNYGMKEGEVVYRGDSLQGTLVKAGIDPWDFALWSAEARYKTTKSHSGVDVPRSKHAWAPSSDPSTWKLPLDSDDRVRDALSRINQTQGIPKASKPTVLQRVRRVAKSRGIGVSSPTSGQKHWSKSGSVAACDSL